MGIVALWSIIIQLYFLLYRFLGFASLGSIVFFV